MEPRIIIDSIEFNLILKRLAYQLIEKIDSLNSEELTNDGLLSGKLGLVYYYLSLYKHFKEDKYLQKIQATLETVFSNLLFAKGSGCSPRR